MKTYRRTWLNLAAGLIAASVSLGAWAQAKPPIKIAAINPLSGAGAFDGQLALEGMQAMAAIINANGGVLGPVVTQAGATGRAAPAAAAAAPRRVADAAAVYLVGHMLADNNARAGTFGLNSQLATRGFAAAKTGTSKDLRDNWCIGYTGRYTVGVWVGNASGAPMHDVSGVSGASDRPRARAPRGHVCRVLRVWRPPPREVDIYDARITAGSGPRTRRQRRCRPMACP